MLSIIIPTLNEEKYLPKLLESIKEQDFKDYEILVADANSKDETRKIVTNFSRALNIRYINTRNKKGPGLQRNFGVKKSKFNRLLFLDADVVLPDNFLEATLKEIQEKKLSMASCYMKAMSNKRIDKLIHRSVNFFMKINQHRKYPRALGGCLFSSKDIHDKIKGFDESIRLCEDYDYVERANRYGMFRMLRSHPIYVSVRRFEKEGRFNMILKYLAIEIHRIINGPIKKDIFGYHQDGR
ncbi:glycosyl transferase family 2 [Candidatus Woesearchaeota archaeon]|nr:glycosyl transferase family 2 [Candidatus Woesearchaeota archaeon]|tara:strand:- start:4242 stop:4961 length:720 start_codon:yes stop_codon:yes gene_type:complete